MHNKTFKAQSERDEVVSAVDNCPYTWSRSKKFKHVAALYKCSEDTVRSVYLKEKNSQDTPGTTFPPEVIEALIAVRQNNRFATWKEATQILQEQFPPELIPSQPVMSRIWIKNGFPTHYHKRQAHLLPFIPPIPYDD